MSCEREAQSPASEATQELFDRYVMDWSPSPASRSPPKPRSLLAQQYLNDYGTISWEYIDHINVATTRRAALSPPPHVEAHTRSCRTVCTQKVLITSVSAKTSPLPPSELTPRCAADVTCAAGKSDTVRPQRAQPTYENDAGNTVDSRLRAETLQHALFTTPKPRACPKGLLHTVSVPVYRQHADR